MNKFAIYYPWVVTFFFLGFVMITVVDLRTSNMEWQEKCKQDNGYPTAIFYMDWHSKWHRLCINPRSVVEVD